MYFDFRKNDVLFYLYSSFKINASHFSSTVFIKKVIGLFSDERFELDIQDIEIFADQVLLEQVMINLIKNGLESKLQKQAESTDSSSEILPIVISVKKVAQTILISIQDSGLGILNPENLFVPFYTTKAGGQGVGLFFCRNIIEKHGGKLSLESRKEHGAVAKVQLPLR
jgi:signal transduction histidine kinase